MGGLFDFLTRRFASECSVLFLRTTSAATLVAAVQGARDYGSRQRRQTILPKRCDRAKIHAGSGFIWGIPP